MFWKHTFRTFRLRFSSLSGVRKIVLMGTIFVAPESIIFSDFFEDLGGGGVLESLPDNTCDTFSTTGIFDAVFPWYARAGAIASSLLFVDTPSSLFWDDKAFFGRCSCPPFFCSWEPFELVFTLKPFEFLSRLMNITLQNTAGPAFRALTN